MTKTPEFDLSITLGVFVIARPFLRPVSILVMKAETIQVDYGKYMS